MLISLLIIAMEASVDYEEDIVGNISCWVTHVSFFCAMGGASNLAERIYTGWTNICIVGA